MRFVPIRVPMFKLITKKIIGSQNEREVKRLRPLVEKINSLELAIQALSDSQLRAKTEEFKNNLAQKAKAGEQDFLDLEAQIKESTSNVEKDKLKAKHRD